MKIEMRHPAYKGGAKVLPDDQAKWEAAGWVAVPKPTTKTTLDKDNEE